MIISRAVRLALLASCPVMMWAAEASGQHAETGDPMLVWKVANFLLLVIVAGYFIYKKGGAFFAARTAQIQRDLVEAAQTRKDAEARCADIERRLGNLADETKNLRDQSRQELEAEGGRIWAETQKNLRKIEAQTVLDIEAVAKLARREMRQYSANLAIDLAAATIRQRMTPETESAILRSALAELERCASAQTPEVA